MEHTSPTASSAPQSHKGRTFPLGPLLVSLLLCAGIGFALYSLYANGRHDAAGVSLAQVDAQKEKNAALRRDAASREALSREAPCTVRQSLLQKSRPDAPAALVAPTPALAPADKAETAPAPADKDKAQPVPADKDKVQPAPVAAPLADHEQTINDRIENATVFIINFQQDGVGSGTGFFVTKHLILTNQHVASKARRIFVINRKLHKAVEAQTVAIANDRGRDYALLQVPPQEGIEPLSFRQDVRRGERVAAWGYPHAVSRNDPKYTALLSGAVLAAPELVYSDGSVSAVLERQPRIIAHTTPLSHGNSGGPLTDKSGLVVGINTLISLDEESYRQTSLSLHATDVLEFLQEKGISLPGSVVP